MKRCAAVPPVEGRHVLEIELGFITLPKPIPVAVAELRAWERLHRGKGVFMRAAPGGWQVIGYEEHGQLLTEQQVREFQSQQDTERALEALARIGGGQR